MALLRQRLPLVQYWGEGGWIPALGGWNDGGEDWVVEDKRDGLVGRGPPLARPFDWSLRVSGPTARGRASTRNCPYGDGTRYGGGWVGVSERSGSIHLSNQLHGPGLGESLERREANIPLFARAH